MGCWMSWSVPYHYISLYDGSHYGFHSQHNIPTSRTAIFYLTSLHFIFLHAYHTWHTRRFWRVPIGGIVIINKNGIWPLWVWGTDGACKMTSVLVLFITDSLVRAVHLENQKTHTHLCVNKFTLNSGLLAFEPRSTGIHDKPLFIGFNILRVINVYVNTRRLCPLPPSATKHSQECSRIQKVRHAGTA